jgi:hypothetical protein
MNYAVYNLEFPSWCDRLDVGPCEFTRTPDYRGAVLSLQHNVTFTAEFEVRASPGTHQVTAQVAVCGDPGGSVFRDNSEGATALDDVLLLLSLLTGREVFASTSDLGVEQHRLLVADARPFAGGGLLRVGIPYEPVPGGTGLHGSYDGGFQQDLQRMYDLTRTARWRNDYGHGHYLGLALDAFRQQPLRARFVLSWALWEHLFALRHRWMSDNAIQRMSSEEKIAFMFHEYILLENGIDEKTRMAIRRLARMRNRLMHYGFFPDDELATGHAVLFLELTEFVVARTLGIATANILDTRERLAAFCEGRRVWTSWEVLSGAARRDGDKGS